jgi:hypothetical protein
MDLSRLSSPISPPFPHFLHPTCMMPFWTVVKTIDREKLIQPLVDILKGFPQAFNTILTVLVE